MKRCLLHGGLIIGRFELPGIEATSIRRATAADLESICLIYNQGIHDRVATLDEDEKSTEEIADWFAEHDERYVVLVLTEDSAIVGWASLNRFSGRCAHAAIADLSVYVRRDRRGLGIGLALLAAIERAARAAGFKKIVLHALAGNERGKRLYGKSGFREVGIFREHGALDGIYVDVLAMEKLLV